MARFTIHYKATGKVVATVTADTPQQAVESYIAEPPGRMYTADELEVRPVQGTEIPAAVEPADKLSTARASLARLVDMAEPMVRGVVDFINDDADTHSTDTTERNRVAQILWIAAGSLNLLAPMLRDAAAGRVAADDLRLHDAWLVFSSLNDLLQETHTTGGNGGSCLTGVKTYLTNLDTALAQLSDGIEPDPVPVTVVDPATVEDKMEIAEPLRRLVGLAAIADGLTTPAVVCELDAATRPGDITGWAPGVADAWRLVRSELGDLVTGVMPKPITDAAIGRLEVGRNVMHTLAISAGQAKPESDDIRRLAISLESACEAFSSECSNLVEKFAKG